jgi:thiol-disulfide isomerase/thioredoxin
VKSPSEEDIKQMNNLKPAVKMMHPLAEVIPWDMELLSKSGTVSFGSLIEDQKPKLLAIYYSMHNCPPCREFTPLLASLYEEFNENDK